MHVGGIGVDLVKLIKYEWGSQGFLFGILQIKYLIVCSTILEQISYDCDTRMYEAAIMKYICDNLNRSIRPGYVVMPSVRT